MADLTLISQATLKTDVEPKLTQLKTDLEKRKELFLKCDAKKRKLWLDKDPVLKMAWEQYKMLKDFFERVDYDNL